MIDLKLIKKLQAAGVTSDTLLTLILEDDSPEQPAAASPASEPEQPQAEPVKKPEQPEQPAAQTEPVKPAADPVLAAIEKLTGAIQASNVLNATRGSAAIKTADEVLAEAYAGRKE